MEIDGPPRDTVLVLGLIERTVFLEMDVEGGLEAVERVSGLIESEETIALKEVNGKIIQVTTEQIHVTTHGSKIAGYPGKISAVQITDSQILVSSGRNMKLLSFDCQIIQQWTLQEEITCLDIHENLIAVGFWNSTVQLISLSTNASTFNSTPNFPLRHEQSTIRHPPNTNPPNRFSRRNLNNLYTPATIPLLQTRKQFH